MFGPGTVDIPYRALQIEPGGCGGYDCAAASRVDAGAFSFLGLVRDWLSRLARDGSVSSDGRDRGKEPDPAWDPRQRKVRRFHNIDSPAGCGAVQETAIWHPRVSADAPSSLRGFVIARSTNRDEYQAMEPFP